MVGSGWDELRADVGEDLLVDVAGGEVGLEPVVGVLVLVLVGEADAFLVLVVFVVSGPDDDGRVVTQKLDVLVGFALDGLEKGRPGRVVAAAEHEVLPYENAELVAGVVKGLLFVDTAAPDADHELVAVGHELDPVVVSLLGDPRDKVVGRNPVAATAVKGYVVDLEEEALAGLALKWSLDELSSAQADPLLDYVFLAITANKSSLDLVQRLLAISNGVPK